MVDWTIVLLVTFCTSSTSTGSPSLNPHVPCLSCTIASVCMMNNKRLHGNTFLKIYSSCCSFFSVFISYTLPQQSPPNWAYHNHCFIRAVPRYHFDKATTNYHNVSQCLPGVEVRGHGRVAEKQRSHHVISRHTVFSIFYLRTQKQEH